MFNKNIALPVQELQPFLCMVKKKKVLMELSVLSLHPPCEYLTSLIGASENTELAVFQLSCSSYCQREVLHSHKQTEWHIFSSA